MDAVQQGGEGMKAAGIGAGGHAQGQITEGGDRGLIAHFHGGHFLRHAPDHLLAAEGLGQNLLAGDAVENGDHSGVRPHQMAAGFHGLPEGAELHGKEQQVHRFGDKRGVLVAEITQLAVEVYAFAAVAPGAFTVRQDQDVFPAQALGEQMGVQHAQSAQADDAHGFDLFHRGTSF